MSTQHEDEPGDDGPIRCPFCNCAYTLVVWTRDGKKYADGKRRRKRRCGSPVCGRSFLGRVEQPEVEKVVGGGKPKRPAVDED